jgi:class 3 adenylate cyclase
VVALLFSDVEGSTRLVQQLGEAGYAKSLTAHRGLIRSAVLAHAGREVECRADEFFAVFPDAQSAVAATVMAQEKLREHPWPEGAEFRVRMGLNTGDPVPGAEGYVGLDVNRTARICAAGHGGQVLLSRSVRRLIGDTHQARELGDYELAGLPAPEPIYQLVIPGWRVEFPPLRAALAEARRSRWRRSHRMAEPTLEEHARRVHVILPDVAREIRGSLTELGAGLFTGQRAVERADAFLARIDHKRLAGRLANQREMALHYASAEREAATLRAQVAAVASVSDHRRTLAESAAEVPELLADPAAITSARASAIHQRVTHATVTLDDAVTFAAGRIDPLSYRLNRTRHRGIYRSGRRYIVPFIDSVGADRTRDFETLEEAANFKAAVRIADKAQRAVSQLPGDSDSWKGWQH